ncbi:hypothetical protein RhiirA4_473858 [Rhizophagus irregularis]|uniref:Uncharacterized protein n=1 Tax=Rhizophagus irregularis TaxID=588596 RepID=A0A2I1H7I3_9GLOM|nr:hypothetical protein RhiirA4_473858 [Rhizophagus irregularis]
MPTLGDLNDYRGNNVIPLALWTRENSVCEILMKCFTNVVQLRRFRTPFHFISKWTTIFEGTYFEVQTAFHLLFSKRLSSEYSIAYNNYSWFSGTLDVQDFNRGIQVDLDTRIPIGKSAIVFFLDFGFRMKDSV